MTKQKKLDCFSHLMPPEGYNNILGAPFPTSFCVPLFPSAIASDLPYGDLERGADVGFKLMEGEGKHTLNSPVLQCGSHMPKHKAESKNHLLQQQRWLGQ